MCSSDLILDRIALSRHHESYLAPTCISRVQQRAVKRPDTSRLFVVRIREVKRFQHLSRVAAEHGRTSSTTNAPSNPGICTKSEPIERRPSPTINNPRRIANKLKDVEITVKRIDAIRLDASLGVPRRK